jgi:GNAT superfamily N-acetyltransferase
MAEVRALSLEEFLAQPSTPALLQQHYDELCVLKHLQTLDPLMAVYRQMEAEDRLLILAAFDPDLVGYSVNFLTRPLHYAGLIVLQNDVLFVDWRARERQVGARLMAETSRTAKERGAKVVLWHAKPDTRLAQIGAERRWKVQDIVYAEELI